MRVTLSASRSEIQHAEAGVTPATDHYARRVWADAFDALTLADGATPLESDDLERLAMSAFLIGREIEYITALERTNALNIGIGRRPS